MKNGRCLLTKTPAYFIMDQTPPDPDLQDSSALYNACMSDVANIQEAGYRQLAFYLYRVALLVVHDQHDREQFAQDAVQYCCERVYEKILECKEPKAFKGWCRQIMKNWIIDQLRKGNRLTPLEDETLERYSNEEVSENIEGEIIRESNISSLRDLLNQAPISPRSKRVVIGRFVDNQGDDHLAQVESELSGNIVRPNNIQVTRAKNITKLRKWPPIMRFFDKE